MKLTFEEARWTLDEKGFWLCLKVKETAPARAFVEKLKTFAKQKLFQIEIKLYRQARSLNANRYLWVLCEKIAQAVGHVTKEDVYIRMVRDAGVFDVLNIPTAGLEDFVRRWKRQGIGWQTAVIQESGIPGYTEVMAFYGSSKYDTKEMFHLLQHVIDTAKELDIETATPDEIALMKARWEDEQAMLALREKR